MKVLFFAKRFPLSYEYNGKYYHRIVSLEAYMEGNMPMVTLSWYVDCTDDDYENNNSLTFSRPERRETFNYIGFSQKWIKLLIESAYWFRKIIDKKMIPMENLIKVFTECRAKCETKLPPLSVN